MAGKLMWIDQKAYSDEDMLRLLRQPDVRLSFSQFGEDLFIWNMLSYRDGFYVDIGCYDPFSFSNTFLAYKFNGWRGINVDADADAIARFRKHRPDDINLNVGVGSRAETREFTVFEEGAVNSFDSNMAAHASNNFSIKDRRQVEIRPLSHILDEHLPADTRIDYMNIDCEGLDYDVILGNDWQKYRPRLLSVEVHDLDMQDPMANRTIRYLADHGYRFVSQYFVTSFFRDERDL